MSGEICTDGRFELIEEYKRRLIESTNIETSPTDMAALDSLLFRFWQMGWLRELGEWIVNVDTDTKRISVTCSRCGGHSGDVRADFYTIDYDDASALIKGILSVPKYCGQCGSLMKGARS